VTRCGRGLLVDKKTTFLSLPKTLPKLYACLPQHMRMPRLSTQVVHLQETYVLVPVRIYIASRPLYIYDTRWEMTIGRLLKTVTVLFRSAVMAETSPASPWGLQSHGRGRRMRAATADDYWLGGGKQAACAVLTGLVLRATSQRGSTTAARRPLRTKLSSSAPRISGHPARARPRAIRATHTH
jgi:hypothetical protein